jgi:hypothetical protein
VGDRRQELVIIGQNLGIENVTSALDACLLTDHEMSLASEDWEQFEDPFGPWEIVDGVAEAEGDNKLVNE